MNARKEFIKRIIKRITKNQSLIDKAAMFVACEKIEGDYLEFGTYKGASFISAFYALEQSFEKRISYSSGLVEENKDNEERRLIWSKMRFIGFDSFEGLPLLDKADHGTEDFKQGMYSCSENDFKRNLIKNHMPMEKVISIKGYFKDTCSPETIRLHKIDKASIIFIDCDLYSSAKSVLNFVSPVLQDGTIIIFDDWYSYKGSPYRGEQKAFYEWSRNSPIAELYNFSEYQKEDWKRISFLVSIKTS